MDPSTLEQVKSKVENLKEKESKLYLVAELMQNSDTVGKPEEFRRLCRAEAAVLLHYHQIEQDICYTIGLLKEIKQYTMLEDTMRGLSDAVSKIKDSVEAELAHLSPESK